MSRHSRTSRRGRGRRSRRHTSPLKRYLPQIIIGVGALVVAAAGLLLATRKGSPSDYVPEYTGGPRIDLDQEVYDYGYVELNTVITTDVEISNVGDQPLRITDTPQVQVLEGC
jgi:hypothetical protein